jgi:hypothetical protein
MSTTLSHDGLPEDVSRFDLLALFERVGQANPKLSATAVSLMRYYVLKTSDGDYHTGRICAVWVQVSRVAETLLSPRSINTAERQLEEAGFVARTAGTNGHRAGDRRDGAIVWAAGINLAPLIDRYKQLKVKAAALDLKSDAIAQCRAEIREITKRIRQSGDVDAQAKAQTILPAGRVANIRKLPDLEAIRDALAAIQEVIEVGQNEQSRNAKPSGAPEAIAAPESQRRSYTKICGAHAADAVSKLTPAMAYSAASKGYQQLIDALGGPAWCNLIEASSRRLPELGITQNTWGRACQHLGRERAALCVLVIDRNHHLPVDHPYRPRSPGRCLSGLIRKASAMSINLPGMMHAAQRRSVEDVPPSPAGADEGASLANLMASTLARLRISSAESFI